MARPAKRTPPAKQLERERIALELRQAGVDYQTIADRLGMKSKGHAYDTVQRALKRANAGPAEDLRDLEVARLDRLQAGHWGKAIKGDDKSTDRVLRIIDQRAKLLGLNAATKHDHTVKLDEQQAVLILTAIRGILADLQLTSAQETIAGEVVAKHLRAIEEGSGTS